MRISYENAASVWAINLGFWAYNVRALSELLRAIRRNEVDGDSAADTQRKRRVRSDSTTEINVIARREFLKASAYASAGCVLAGAAFLPGQPNPKSVTGRGSLKAHAHRHGLLAGCAVAPAILRDEPTYGAVLAEQYSLMVATSAMKFGRLSPKPGVYNFDDADSLLAFATEHQIRMRGHNFIWHEQLPPWFAGTVTRDNARKILTDHILTVGGHYRGKMHSWDVVNEALNLPDEQPNGLRKTPWYELIGPDYLDLAFKTARQADPEAKLTYNEYGIEYDNEASDKKRAATLDLLRGFKQRGVPIDALGIQSHIFATYPSSFGRGIREVIAAAAEMGLEIYITGLDVNDDGLDSDDFTSRDHTVAQVYRNYLDCILENKAVKAILTWGITDRHTWLDTFLRDKKKHPNRPERCLPFDPAYNPTEAFFAIQEAFDHAPKR